MKEITANMLINIKTASVYLGVSCQTLRNYEKKGILIPQYKLPSGHRRYSKQQLDDFRNSGK